LLEVIPFLLETFEKITKECFVMFSHYIFPLFGVEPAGVESAASNWFGVESAASNRQRRIGGVESSPARSSSRGTATTAGGDYNRHYGLFSASAINT